MASHHDDNVQSSKSSIWHTIFLWVLRILGIPQRHLDVLEDSAAGRALVFQAFALIISSVAFVVTTGMYSYVLLGNSLWQSIGLALLVGAILFAIDRVTLTDMRSNPGVGRGKAWVVRIATVFMALMLAILNGVQSHKDDIARIQAANANADAASRLQSPDMTARVEASRAALRQSQADAQRRDALRQQLTAAQYEVAKAEAELARELGGAFDPSTGVQRVAGRGPKAIHFEAVRDAARQRASALQAELLALGDVDARNTQAEATLKSLQEDALKKGQAEQQGAAKKIEALFELLCHEPTAWISFGYGVVLALFPEILLLCAMARQPSIEEVYTAITPLERRRTNALIAQSAMAMKAEIAARARRMEAAQRSAAKGNGAPGSAGRSGPGFGLGNAHA
jgi:hypothetical protein